MDKRIEILKDLEKHCQKLNASWNAMEYLKERVAKQLGVSDRELLDAGIFLRRETVDESK